MGSFEPCSGNGDTSESSFRKLKRQISNSYNVGKSVVEEGMRLASNMATATGPSMASENKQTTDNSSETVPIPRDERLENIKRVAKDLAYDIVYFKSGVKKLRPSSKYAVTLRRTVDEMLERHEIVFTGVVKKLDISKVTIQNVLDEMYTDKTFNWGRVVSVYALGGRMAQHAGDTHKQELIDRIAEWVGEYVADNLSEWILTQGSWDAFHDFFPEHRSLEDRIWQGLLMTAVGLGALATMVAVR